MTKRALNFIKRLLIDIGGFSLIIAAALVGWLPGPLGIPLLIAGLSLLAHNHDWAKRWLELVKTNGLKLLDKVFTGSPSTKRVLDILCFVLIFITIYLFNINGSRIVQSIATISGFMAGLIFFGNRQRFKRIGSFLKTHKNKHKNK